MPELPYRTPESPEPPKPDDAALGAHRSTHRPGPLARALVPSVAIAVFVVGVTGFLALAAHAWALWLVSVFAGLVALAVGALPVITRRHDRVDLYADGLAVVRRGVRTVVPFETVDAVWFDIAIQGTALGDLARVTALRLVGHDGVEHTVPLHVTEPDRILRAIDQACSTVHLAAARETLAQGERLTFGTVAVDRTGITLRGTTVAWADLRLVRFKPGRIAFFRSRGPFPWRTVRMDSVPHPLLFAKIVEGCALRTEVDDPLRKRFG